MPLTVFVTGEVKPDQLEQIKGAAPGADVRYFAKMADLEAVIRWCPEKDPANRYPNALSLEESLAELVKRELVDRKDALARAVHPEELERLL